MTYPFPWFLCSDFRFSRRTIVHVVIFTRTLRERERKGKWLRFNKSCMYFSSSERAGCETTLSLPPSSVKLLLLLIGVVLVVVVVIVRDFVIIVVVFLILFFFLLLLIPLFLFLEFLFLLHTKTPESVSNPPPALPSSSFSVA